MIEIFNYIQIIIIIQADDQKSKISVFLFL